MFKNVSSQKIAVFAFDTTSGAAKTGDSANITVYVSKDWGSVTVLTDTSATEMDATNAKGWYLFDVAQAETNADALLFTGKSSTSNISIVGQLIYTQPPNFTAQSIDSNGRVDVIKIAGTTQTARDIGTSVLLSSGTGTGQLDFTSGVVKGNAVQWLGGTIPAVNVTGVPLVDLKYTLGTISPATAGSVRADAVTGAAGSVTGAVGSVTGAVGSVATGGIAAASFAAGAVDAAALATDAANEIADALLDRSAGVETGLTPRQALRLIASTTGAKVSGGGTTTNTFRNAVADAKDRVTATVDSSGNRTAITYDLT